MAEISIPSPPLSPSSMWGDNNGGGLAAVAALSLILLCHFFKRLFFRIRSMSSSASSSSPLVSDSHPLSSTRVRVSELISEGDLKRLIDNLDEKATEIEKWENVTDKSKNGLSYKAKCCQPKDAPPKYLSVTVFENCSPEVLRDFYMDCEFRKQWDKTVVDHQQLQIDEKNGIEIGRTIKKFPLLTHREYVLAWKIWEGSNRTFYCFTKECDHAATPRQKKYVRVAFYRSGWRIRQVPGRNACEIKMVHQEDAGLNVEMAKLVFAKGIWSYVCKMNDALHKYSVFRHPQSSLAMTAVSLMQKVPPELDAISRTTLLNQASTATQEDTGTNSRKITRKPSKKLITNGLLLVGGIICLSHGNSGLCAKVAVAFVLKKLSKRGPSSGQNN